jgi:hypothetical protein
MLAIANLINAGDYEEAERLLNAAEPFQNASTALANAIMALDRTPTGKPATQKERQPAMRKTA